mmetsp:Transcript_34780/g.99912  ORF Transcript_34780/g.99912 Transcript_34780/m.99912 type:complete len:207 (-) Transcript_34780:141-761(-)
MQSMACAVKPKVALETRATCSLVRPPSSAPRKVTIPHWPSILAFSEASPAGPARAPAKGSWRSDQPRGVHTCSKERIQARPSTAMVRLSPSVIVNNASSTCLKSRAPGSSKPLPPPEPTAWTKCSWPPPTGDIRDSTTLSPCAAWRPARATRAPALAWRPRRRAALSRAAAASPPEATEAGKWLGPAWLALLAQDRVEGASGRLAC